MIDKRQELSVAKQCEPLKVNRSSVYYQPAPVATEDLEAMRELDEIHLLRPFLGSRPLVDALAKQGLTVNRKRLLRLVRVMGKSPIYPKPRTSRPGEGVGHRLYPYSLDGPVIERPYQVWAADITYTPMARGFCYLVSIIDVFSRRLLAWWLWISLDTRFCLERPSEALERHGRPEIINTDQGSHFTSSAFTGLLVAQGVKITMHGKGSWRDNIPIERCWWSPKYQHVHLRAHDDLRAARAGIAAYIEYYNTERQHSSLGKLTPTGAYEKTRADFAAETTNRRWLEL